MTDRAITRSELYQLVWSKPMISLAKQFEISDVGLRKICKKMAIPLPKIGHWQRVKAGKKIKMPELPISTSDETVTLREVDRVVRLKEYPWSKLQLQIENDPNLNLIVPERLHNPDDLILEFKNYLAARQKAKRAGGYLDWQNHLAISVPDELMKRALVFMDTFIKLARARGHSFEVSSRCTFLIIRDQRIEIKLMERSRVEIEPQQPGQHWPTRVFHATGKLVFKAGTYDQIEWLDGKRSIEQRLSNILARLETKINDLHEIWRQNRIREEEEERLRLIEREKDQRKYRELEAFKLLLNKSLRWQRVRILREFIAEVKNRPTRDSNKDEVDEWVRWATKKADWYDPQINSEDELLSQVDRETLTIPSK